MFTTETPTDVEKTNKLGAGGSLDGERKYCSQYCQSTQLYTSSVDPSNCSGLLELNNVNYPVDNISIIIISVSKAKSGTKVSFKESTTLLYVQTKNWESHGHREDYLELHSVRKKEGKGGGWGGGWGGCVCSTTTGPTIGNYVYLPYDLSK